MRRHLAVIAFVLLAYPFAARAAPPAKAHIGILGVLPLSNPATGRLWTALTDALRKRGWVEGQNLTVTYRASQGLNARYAPLAAELVAAHPDVVVAVGPGAVKAVEQRTKTIPIVMVGVPEPVKLGFIASLAHPGGNITGVSPATEDVFGKAVQLLTEVRPGISRIAYLGYGEPRYWQGTVELSNAAARRLGLRLQMIPLTAPADFAPALAAVAKSRPDALIVSSAPLFRPQTAKIAAFAIAHRLPTLTFAPPMVHGGLLMAYHPDDPSLFERTAAIVAKLLSGAKPADIPVEEPDKFDLIINLKTAHAIGLDIPLLLRAQAGELIQ